MGQCLLLVASSISEDTHGVPVRLIRSSISLQSFSDHFPSQFGSSGFPSILLPSLGGATNFTQPWRGYLFLRKPWRGHILCARLREAAYWTYAPVLCTADDLSNKRDHVRHLFTLLL